MTKISKSIYLEYEVFQKLAELKKEYGSIGKAIENLIREHEQLKRQSELQEKNVSERLKKIEEELINMKEIIIKIGKTWGVKV